MAAPTSQPPRTPATVQIRIGDYPTPFWLCALGIAGMALGSFGTWVTTGFASASGVEVDGWIVTILAVITGAILVGWAKRRLTSSANILIALGVIGVAIGVYAYAFYANDDNELIRVGWGIYMVIAGSALVAISGFLLRREPKATLS